MTITDIALEFLTRAKGMTREAIRSAYEALTPEVRKEYRRLEKASFFTAEKARLDAREEHLSPSDKYKLVVTPFQTGEGTWGYTQGLVFKIGFDEPIAEIQRNYSSFPFCWVDAHPNGHAYLICGVDYQGQTVIELDTGNRREFLPEAASKGHGFCWAKYEFDSATQMVIVDGCYWACPYEYRFYDFSDPMQGWPEIESDTCIYADVRMPSLEPDGTIKCYQTWDDDDSDDEKRELSSILTFRREASKLIQVDEWVSDAEKQRRAEREESEKRYEQWKTAFRTTDSLYLAYAELIKDPELSPESYESCGVTHSDWCPHFQGHESRWCRRIRKDGAITIDLEWAVETGPIKLIIYRDGKRIEDKFFPHSADGMREAFAHAKRVGRG